MATMIRAENITTEEVEEFGPFPYVQLTHELLTVGPDGRQLMAYDGADWHMEGRCFTDVVIFATEEGA